MKSTLSDFALPNPQEVEWALLAEIINAPENIYSVMGTVTTEMFSNPHNLKVWKVIMDMYSNHESIRMETIYPKVDMTNFTNILSQNVRGTVTTAIDLATSLADAYIKRQAYFLAVETLQRIERGDSGMNITKRFDNFSKELAVGADDNAFVTMEDAANELAESMNSGREEKMPTGIRTLDWMTYGGLGCGSLIVLGARPSVGKTTIGLQIAQYMSFDKQVAFFSMEMTPKELARKVIIATGQVTPSQFSAKQVDFVGFEKAVTMACSKNLRICRKALSFDEICTKIRLAHMQGKCDVAFIDHLHLIPLRNTKDTLAQKIAEITRGLKLLAMELEIPIVLLCQLNRESAKDNRAPQVTDLRDSGSIEQDANTVILLDRTKNSVGEVVPNSIDLWLRKNREGKITLDNPIVLVGDDNYANFKENGNY